MSDRYARQKLLAAVGEAGQQRIADAVYVVGDAAQPAAVVEREYLVRAGARHFDAPSGRSPSFSHAAAFHHSAARDFAAGAWRALVQLNRALARD